MQKIWKLHGAEQHRAVVEATTRLLADPTLAPNRRARCLYLQADNLRKLGEFSEAKDAFAQTATYCRQTEPAPWIDSSYDQKVDIAPLCELEKVLIAERQAGPFPVSSTGFTHYAWQFHKSKPATAILFAEHCIRRFGEQAASQQAEHRRKFGDSLPKIQPGSQQEKEMWRDYWALYDVGACHYVIGLACAVEARVQADEHEDVARRLVEKGIRSLEAVLARYPAAQCFDPAGPWYWRVRDGADKHLPELRDLQRRLRSR